MLAKARDDEPVFILRAQDILAADTVERWAIDARLLGVDTDKVHKAMQLAQSMREWSGLQKVPD